MDVTRHVPASHVRFPQIVSSPGQSTVLLQGMTFTAPPVPQDPLLVPLMLLVDPAPTPPAPPVFRLKSPLMPSNQTQPDDNRSIMRPIPDVLALNLTAG